MTGQQPDNPYADEDPTWSATPPPQGYSDVPAYQPPAPMPDPAADAEIVAHARKNLQARADFRKHLMVYGAVMGLLVAIWLVTSPFDYFWPIWPMMGWGLAIVLHGMTLWWDAPPSDQAVADEARRIAERARRRPDNGGSISG